MKAKAPRLVAAAALAFALSAAAAPPGQDKKPRPGPASKPTAAAASTEDRADIDRSTITGNRELPKVLHIVPWKKPLPGELEGRPVSSVLDEALAPLDRDVFRRRIDYDVQARPRAAAAPR